MRLLTRSAGCKSQPAFSNISPSVDGICYDALVRPRKSEPGQNGTSEAYRNILIEEIEKRNGGNLEMDQYQSKGKYPVHAE